MSAQLARTLLATLGAALVVAACGGGGSAAAPSGELLVTVADLQGRYVEGARLELLGTSARTDATGQARLAVPVGREVALRVAQDAHAEQVRVLDLPAAAADRRTTLDVVLVPREPPQTLARIEAGGDARGRHGVRVVFPPAALVDASGATVSGAVTLAMTAADATTPALGGFPGALEVLAEDGARANFVAFGLAEFRPTQRGRPLNLATGRTARIELPLFATLRPDGTAIAAGDRLQLLSLDPVTGLWHAETEGRVILSAQAPSGLALSATVAHFSTYAASLFPYQPAYVSLSVVVPGVPAGTTCTYLDALQTDGFIDVGEAGPILGAMTQPLRFMPCLRNEVPTRISVWRGRGNYCFRTRVDGVLWRACGRFDTADGDAWTLRLTEVRAIVPQLSFLGEQRSLSVDGRRLLTNSSQAASVRVDVPDATDRVELRADGAALATFEPQMFYRYLWDTSTLPEGEHTLVARETRGTLSADSAPLALTVDRTARRATAWRPAAVRLSVMPPGGTESERIVVAADMRLDPSSTRLSVTPTQELPAGTAELTWGGLQDVAGNPATGTLAAAWPVGPSPTATLAHAATERFGLAVGPSGQAIVASNATYTSALVQTLADGAWSVLGNVAFALPNYSRNSALDLAQDSTGTPYLMVAAHLPAPTNRVQVAVHRWSGTAWQAVGPALECAAQRFPRLIVDRQGRPIVAGQEDLAPGFPLTVRRFDPGSGAWVRLGDGLVGNARLMMPIDPTVNHVQLGLDPDDQPFVVWTQLSTDGERAEGAAARWDGRAWQAMGAPDPLLAGATDAAWIGGAPWVVAVNARVAGVSGPAHALRFDGAAWVATRIGIGDDRVVASLADAGGTPAIAYVDALGLKLTTWRAGAVPDGGCSDAS